ncbi:MAG: hypothetical protein WAN43_14645 [Rhodomicrobium sp.]|jgi:hypothetical protein
MPLGVKWSLIAGLALLCGGAAYLMIARGPALLIDLGGALAGCF